MNITGFRNQVHKLQENERRPNFRGKMGFPRYAMSRVRADGLAGFDVSVRRSGWWRD